MVILDEVGEPSKLLRLAAPSEESCRDALRIAWLGLLEPGLAFVLALIGLADTKAGVATLIASTEAPMIAVLSAVFLRERLSARFFLLSAIALTGLALASGSHRAISGDLIADGLIALGTFIAALYVVLSSQVIVERDPVLVVACQQLVAGTLIDLLNTRVPRADASANSFAASVFGLPRHVGTVGCAGRDDTS